MKYVSLAFGGALVAATVLSQALPAQAAVRAGTLRCNVSAGLGLIITSKKELSCVFRSTRGFSERYAGSISKFGLDIGKTNRGVLVWTVFSATDGRARGALTGGYGGVSAGATVGVGGGANALVGGSDRSITLQPFSAQAQTGVSLAAGVASMTLRPLR